MKHHKRKSQHPGPRLVRTLPKPGESQPALPRWMGMACAVAVGIFALLLGVRTLTTEDLGYHLAYGEHFLTTGHIVDDAFGTYQIIPPGKARYELPPGAWIDAAGQYRFPNANWLSQVVMAIVWRVGGLVGLSVLLACLSAGIFAILATTMRRLGAGPLGIAAAMLMTAMASYERILLRPEVFGYLILAAELFVLVRGKLGWGSVAALVVLQVLLVNLHSYFLLGLGLTGAFAIEDGLRRLWRRWRSPIKERPDAAGGAGRVVWIALGLQVLACFVNPWTWRLALLPIRTLLFMRAHHIAGGALTETGHPWAVIGEFFSPFATGVFEISRVSQAFIALLVLAGAGLLCAAWLRRWAHVLVMAAMTGAALTMRRNIAPAAILVTPLAISNCRDALTTLVRRLAGPGGRLRVAESLAATALLLAGGVGAITVITQRFYTSESRPVRFGLGPSKTYLPLSAADWINRNKPKGRVWTDYNTSSNLYWFIKPHRDMPVLTNTWAYPPDVMELVLAVSRGRADYRTVFDALDVQVVVLKVDYTSSPLARRMLADPNWAPVEIDCTYMTFLRANGPNAALARRARLTPDDLDTTAYVDRLRELDPVQSFPVYLGASLLSEIRWNAKAVEVIDLALANWPNAQHVERLWDMKGTCLVDLGWNAFRANPPDIETQHKCWKEARACFIKATQINPDYKPAADHLHLINEDIARYW